MHRRDVLKGLAGTLPLTVAGRVWAAPKADMRTLVVFLRGAYDAANVVIPVSSTFYYESRPTIAVPKPGTSSPDAAIALTPEWGLHPALKDSLLPLWERKQLAFVPFAGTDDLTRSHFETQDTIELGQPVQGSRNYNSGFMARLASVLTRTKPIAYTEQLPLVFRGGPAIPNIGIGSVSKPGVDDRQAKLITSMYAKDSLGGMVSEGFKVRDDVYKTVEMAASDRGAIGRIVGGFLGEGAVVDHLVAGLREHRDQVFLQLEARVVAADRNPHEATVVVTAADFRAQSGGRRGSRISRRMLVPRWKSSSK